VADIRDAAIPPSDTVLLVDVLHYFRKDAQDRILLSAARAVNAGGRLVVREADTERGIRSWVTLVEERLFTAVGYNRGERVFFRPVRELCQKLEEAGLACEVRPAWARTPFANMLLVARRPQKQVRPSD
jgi:hypothetical protein